MPFVLHNSVPTFPKHNVISSLWGGHNFPVGKPLLTSVDQPIGEKAVKRCLKFEYELLQPDIIKILRRALLEGVLQFSSDLGESKKTRKHYICLSAH